jgi:chemotaxis protein CheC
MSGVNELQLDALTEGFNIALGAAAATFSELVHEPIQISVPSIELLSPAEMRERIALLYAESGNAQLCGIEQSFELNGSLRAGTMLLFTQSGSLEIIRLMLGQEIMIKQFTDLEQDALAEIGNIITNSCMSCFADLFNMNMTGTLPQVKLNNKLSLTPAYFGDDTILLAQIALSLTTRNTRGLVLFFMDAKTIRKFIALTEHGLSAFA